MDLLHLNTFAPVVGAVFGMVVLWKLIKFATKTYQSPLRDLPGPPSPSWIWGQFRVLFNSPIAVPQEEWVAKYGKNIRYTEILNVRPFLLREAVGLIHTVMNHTQSNRLLTMDTRALNHILTHSTEFQKTTVARKSLINFIGEG